jgi:hypothetical protein
MLDAYKTVRWCTATVWWVLLLFAADCTPPPFIFTRINNYQRDHFSGNDVSGSTIGLCMLLTDTGSVQPGTIPSELIVKKVRLVRPDLDFMEPDSVDARLRRSLGAEEVRRFRSLLYNGDVVALQAMDTVWRAVGYDYLLAIRLQRGMYIKTFNQMMRKRYVIEAELWDCSEVETTWRVIIDGTCTRKGYSDRRFLLASLEQITAALPSAVPAYDTKSW